MRRREFILNCLLLGAIGISFFSLLNIIVNLVFRQSYDGLPIGAMLIICLIFLGLYGLSRRGHITASAFGFMALFFIPVAFTLYSWGIEVPVGLLALALIIVFASILVSTRFAFMATGFVSLTIAILAYCQSTGITSPNFYWKHRTLGWQDSLFFIGLFCILALVSWLSNREIERSLKRARRSEAALKKERDSLEIRVEERTRELKEAQIEKITQLSRFAEFGRLSSGLFHDLINPLTAVSLHLEQINNLDIRELKGVRLHLEHALEANRKMETFIQAIQKQLRQQEVKSNFSLNEEIDQILHILDYKARKANIKIKFESVEEIITYGNPLKFHQMMTNLISNAIDAYEDISSSTQRVVSVKVIRQKEKANIAVQDWGAGIARQNLSKIFDPFFTTKDSTRGTGIGLSITKGIIEHDFQGKIAVESNEDKGTTFTVEFPLQNDLIGEAIPTEGYHVSQ